MNEKFDFSRFRKYLFHDLKSAAGSFTLSLLVCGCVPLIIVAVTFILSVVSGDGTSFVVSNSMRLLFIFLSCMVCAISFPMKHYGKLTEKRYGSDWLMVPASSLEKFISMLLLSCAVLPLCLFALMVITDGLVCLLTDVYDEPILRLVYGSSGLLPLKRLFPNIGMAFHLEFCGWILMFTLGAILFKKSKTAKTIAAYLGVVVLFIAILLLVVGSGFTSINGIEGFQDYFDIDEVSAKFWLRFAIISFYTVFFALMDIGIYFRIKTLSH